MPLLRSLFACLLVWTMAANLRAKPTLYIIGDSTVRNSTTGQMGWGDLLVRHFDPAKIDIVNRAIGGRSSRTFLTEGRWDAVLANLRAGDFVLIQFGHNDGGKLNDERCRASIKGIGDESEEIIRATDGRAETVRTYGWYLRKYIADAKSKSAMPLIVAPIPRNLWKDGGIAYDRGSSHALWAKQVAGEEKVPFVDLGGKLVDLYQDIGLVETGRLYADGDHTHTNPAGAAFNAAVMADAIRSLDGCQLAKGLLAGDLWLPAVFSDHMVLQRDQPTSIWGTGARGAEVTVKLGETMVRTRCDANGDWSADLPALPAGGPHMLELVAGAASRRFSDVMIGEVWLWFGHAGNDAGATRGPDDASLRVFRVGAVPREFPQREIAGKWMPCASSSTAGFSNSACDFGRALRERFRIPVGIVVCTCQECSVESWVSRGFLERDAQSNVLLKAFGARQIRFRDNPKLFEDYGALRAKWESGPPPEDPDPVRDPRSPAVLYNGMIAPLVSYAIHGVAWRPVESPEAPAPEVCKLLIDDCRSCRKNPDLRFLLVSGAGSSTRILDSEGRPLDLHKTEP